MARRYVLVACGSLIAAATLLPASNSHAGPPAAHPDLQGVWVNFDSTPLEAASSDDAARLKALATWFPGIDAPGERREIRGPNPAPEFTDTNVKRSVRRRSLVVQAGAGARLYQHPAADRTERRVVLLSRPGTPQPRLPG